MHQTARRHSIGHRLQNRVFNLLYQRSLLYNICWEDPAVDRRAMAIGRDDELLVITSAGCNVLDYALEGPRRIWAVDANPRQTALLDLKIAAIRELDHDDFFALFGRGAHPQATAHYRRSLRRHLTPASRDFWDRHIAWFQAGSGRRTFYDRGLSGRLASVVVRLMRTCPGIWHGVRDLLDADDLAVQEALYRRHLEPFLGGRVFRAFIDRQTTMSMLGVPYAQKQEVARSHETGIAGFVRSCLEYVCCRLPFADNHFWGLYLRGHYTPRCCPRYLQPTGFAALKKGLVEAIVPITATVEQALDERPELHPSRCVLLDHMDWMGSYFPEALVGEWERLFERVRADCRFLFRSAMQVPAFLADCRVRRGGVVAPLREHLTLYPELAARLTDHDRVHTYASFHIADLAA